MRSPTRQQTSSPCVPRRAARCPSPARRALDRHPCGRAKPRTTVIGDAEGLLEPVRLLLTTILVWVRPRQDLVLENLLLATSSPFSAVPLELDHAPGFVRGTSCFGC